MATNSQALPMPMSANGASLANERFGFTLFVSICLHVVLILGVGYGVIEQLETQTSMDITLAQYRSNEAPDEADFLAQENQLGSGNQDNKAATSTPIQSRFNADVIQDVSPFITEQAPVKPTSQAVLSIETSALDRVNQIDYSDESLSDSERLTEELNPDSLNQTLASLQAQLDVHRQEYAKRPRKYTISSASTQKARDALYLDSWRKKIESIGNLNYPQQASQDKIYGSLRMLVALRPDGSVDEVRILSSSGHSVLDEAATLIVHLAAPFDPFPPQMRRDVDILEIIRTWQFHDSNSFRSF